MSTRTNIWTNDGGNTEIESGLPVIERALEFNGTSDYIEISSYSISPGFYIAFIDNSGNWNFENDLSNIPNEDNAGNLRIGKNGSTYFDGYILGCWDGDINQIEREKIKNNTFPKNTIMANILNIDFNQESATTGQLDEENGKTVTMSHSVKNFIDINTLR